MFGDGLEPAHGNLLFFGGIEIGQKNLSLKTDLVKKKLRCVASERGGYFLDAVLAAQSSSHMKQIQPRPEIRVHTLAVRAFERFSMNLISLQRRIALVRKKRVE